MRIRIRIDGATRICMRPFLATKGSKREVNGPWNFQDEEDVLPIFFSSLAPYTSSLHMNSLRIIR